MATTPEEILAKGKGPVQTTWVDQPPQHVSPTTSQRPETSEEQPTGVENVKYDTVTAQGAPNNPHSPRDVVERGLVNDGALAPKVASNPKEGFYTRWFRENSPYQPPTKEELEKERKKQKRESIFAAISDGIAALSNLYFTSQYAPNAYDPSKGMSATTKARFDKLKKEREDKHRQYMEGFMRAMKLDADDARDERNWQHSIEREKITDRWRQEDEDRKRDKDEFDAQNRQLKLKYLQGKIDLQEYLNEQERLETDYMQKYGMKMPTTPKPSSGQGGGSGMEQYPAYNPTTGETINITANGLIIQ